MRNYLEELLEELAEETEGRERPQSALLTAEPLAAMPLYGYGVPLAGAALLARGARGTGENPTTGGAGSPPLSGEARGAKTEGGGTGELPQSRLGEPRQLPRGGSLRDGETRGMVMSPPYKSVESLRKRLRWGAMAAAYRANTPYSASADATFPARERRGFAVSELDAAVRRDARRYDGEMTLY